MWASNRTPIVITTSLKKEQMQKLTQWFNAFQSSVNWKQNHNEMNASQKFDWNAFNSRETLKLYGTQAVVKRLEASYSKIWQVFRRLSKRKWKKVQTQGRRSTTRMFTFVSTGKEASCLVHCLVGVLPVCINSVLPSQHPINETALEKFQWSNYRIITRETQQIEALEITGPKGLYVAVWGLSSPGNSNTRRYVTYIRVFELQGL